MILRATPSNVQGELAHVIPNIYGNYGLGFTDFGAYCVGIYIIEENRFGEPCHIDGGMIGTIDFEEYEDTDLLIPMFYKDYYTNTILSDSFNIPLDDRGSVESTPLYLEEPISVSRPPGVRHELELLTYEWDTESNTLLISYDGIVIVELGKNGYTANVYGRSVIDDIYIAEA